MEAVILKKVYAVYCGDWSIKKMLLRTEITSNTSITSVTSKAQMCMTIKYKPQLSPS
jgi:hypothetical protein